MSLTPAVELRAGAAHVFVESLQEPLLDPGDLHHLLRVLRIGDDDLVTLSDGVGAWTTARLHGERVAVTGPIRHEAERRVVTVAAAIPKGDRLEWMVQKLTELGVARMVFVDFQRSVVRWDRERTAKQLARMRRITREAAMQSRRVRLPVVEGVVAAAVALTWPDVVVADPAGRPLCAGGVIEGLGTGDGPLTVIIGPEGGFSGSELDIIGRTGAEPSALGAGLPMISLSEQVLRVETAAIAAAVMLCR
ncbi:MAG: 16S rRNA (uracil(1498)-N(3))-methyltransferase [Ilumatobacteraceae bacterium]